MSDWDGQIDVALVGREDWCGSSRQEVSVRGVGRGVEVSVRDKKKKLVKSKSGLGVSAAVWARCVAATVHGLAPPRAGDGAVRDVTRCRCRMEGAISLLFMEDFCEKGGSGFQICLEVFRFGFLQFLVLNLFETFFIFEFFQNAS